MAQELVITSVPRGIKLGRTGFQVVMRTAGMRQDICDQLESLGVYRHLPPGGGPNPTCYFHRSVETNAGRLSVLGRVVDAGSDYSNRSNKLAHLIAISQQELAALRESSPAAVLAAVEPRLARTWPGGPEERPQPFALHAMPSVTAGICRGWQQVARDAGWGGVLAEQATRGRPTLVIAPTSSPEWCQQLLSLFQEALALVPPQKRWDVTFDTTVLTAAPVLWRGTYAGSPESAARQPGLLVVDLSSPIAVPPEFMALPLVAVARHGVQAPASAPVPGLPPTVPGHPAPSIPGVPAPPPTVVPAGWGDIPVPPAGGSPRISTGSRLTGTWPPGRGHNYDAPNQAWIKWVSLGVFAPLLMSVLITGFFWVYRPKQQQSQAQEKINAWANAENGTPPSGIEPPTIDDWLTAYGIPVDPPEDKQPALHKARLETVLPFLTDALLTKDLGPDEVKDKGRVENLVAACEKILRGDATAVEFWAVGIPREQGLGLEDTSGPEAIVNGMIKESNGPDQNTHTYRDVTEWWKAALAFARFVDKPHDKDDAAATEHAAEIASWNILLPANVRKHAAQVVEKGFPRPEGDKRTLAEMRKAFINECQNQRPPKGDPVGQGETDPKQAETPAVAEAPEKKRKQLWERFRTRVQSNPPTWPEEKGKSFQIFSDMDIDGSLEFEISLGGAGEWRARAVKVTADQEQSQGRREWKFQGVPGNPDKKWATLVIEPAVDGKDGTVSLTLEKDAPDVCRYVPIRLRLVGNDPQSEPSDLRLGGQPRKSSWQPPGDNGSGNVGALVDPAGPVHLHIAGGEAKELVQQLADVESCRFQLQEPSKGSGPVRIAWDSPQSKKPRQRSGTLEWRHMFPSQSPRESVLFEPVIVTFVPKDAALSLERPDGVKPWAERSTRHAKLFGQANEPTLLGWVGEKKDYCKAPPRGVPWDEVVWQLVEEVKQGDGRLEKIQLRDVRNWPFIKGGATTRSKLLDEWRDTAKDHVREDLVSFIDGDFKKSNPEPPMTVASGEKNKEWDDWNKRRADNQNAILQNKLSEVARRYLEQKGKDEIPESKLAAIYVLRDLDGLMLAKADGVADVFLNQRLASLLKMTVTIPFTFDKKDGSNTNESYAVDVLVIEGVGDQPR